MSRASTPEAGAPALSQKRLESPHSVADEVSKMLDRYQHRPRLDDVRLIERYSEFEFHIRVDFIVRKTNEEFVAYFERAKIICGCDANGEVSKVNASFGSELAHIFRHAGDNRFIAGPGRNKGAVLVDVVQAVQDPEIISLPTFVWFERRKSVDSLSPHLLYFSANRAFVLRGFLSNEEAGLFPVDGGSAPCEVEL